MILIFAGAGGVVCDLARKISDYGNYSTRNLSLMLNLKIS